MLSILTNLFSGISIGLCRPLKWHTTNCSNNAAIGLYIMLYAGL